MAVKCLLERNKATVNSDVWSLACMLVELFTRKCWKQLLDDKEAATGKKVMNWIAKLNQLLPSRERMSSLTTVPAKHDWCFPPGHSRGLFQV